MQHKYKWCIVSTFGVFSCNSLELGSLSVRGSDIEVSGLQAVDHAGEKIYANEQLREAVACIAAARNADRPVVLMIGAHAIKLGLSQYLIELIQQRVITHVATNGAGVIHDFELAMLGGTSEDVAKWIRIGQFGLWKETGRLNDIISEAAQRNEGLGEAVGRVIEEEKFPHRDISICAAGWRCRVPVTSHVSIGSDIIHGYPNCDGAALGKTSHTDFLIFAKAIEELEGGVFLNIGSAVTGPEVYLKALSMARNIARQEGRTITDFTTAVFDVVDLPENWRDGPGPRPQGKDGAATGETHPLYYFRPWKTILCRTVADGGQSYYVKGDHRETIPALWHHLAHGSDEVEA